MSPTKDEENKIEYQSSDGSLAPRSINANSLNSLTLDEYNCAQKLNDACRRRGLKHLNSLQIVKYIFQANKCLRSYEYFEPSHYKIIEHALQQIELGEEIRHRYRREYPISGSALQALLDVDPKILLPCGEDKQGRHIITLNFTSKFWKWLKEGDLRLKYDLFTIAAIEAFELAVTDIAEARKGFLVITNQPFGSQQGLYDLFSLTRSVSRCVSPSLGNGLKGIIGFVNAPFVRVVSNMIIHLLPPQVRGITTVISRVEDLKGKDFEIPLANLNVEVGGSLNLDSQRYISMRLEKLNASIDTIRFER